MKISKRTADALMTLIDHSRRDISYDEGGTYVDADGNLDKRATKQAGEAIEFIKQLIILN